MIDLDREVTAWSNAAAAAGCAGAERAAELRDHLYSEIEAARSRGLSDEQAFAAAVAKLGTPAQLAAEHAKNRTALGVVCSAVSRDERLAGRGVPRAVLRAHALTWAAVMVSLSFLMVRVGVRKDTAWVLSSVLIPLWYASELLVRRWLRHRPDAAAR